jgi:hypothetical protein
MSRACSCCTRVFEDAELNPRQVGKGYTSRTVYYCAGCIEKKCQGAQLKSARTIYRKQAYARAYR